MITRWLAVIALITTIGFADAVPASAATGPPAPPSSDSFYSAPALPATATPGAILRSRSVSIAALGLPLAVRAWQLMYVSRDSHDQPVADITTVLVPNRAAATAPRPLLSYQVAEDSLTELCAPSYEMRLGDEAEEPLILAALERGWAVAVPDYEGLASQWAAGVQAGHAVLDGVRAAEAFTPLGLSASTPVGLWGYSGGGQASAWASELQPAYAPGLRLAGVAEGGVPANIAGVARKLDGGAFSGIYLGAAVGISRAYPDLIDTDELLTAAGKRAFAQLGRECIDEFVPQFAFRKIESYTVGGVDPLTVPSVAHAVALDELGQRLPQAPIYLYMSVNDQLIPVADDDSLAATYCAGGVAVDYVKDELSEHISLAVTGAGAAIDYLADRFAGRPAPSTCASGPTTMVTTLGSGPALTTMLGSLLGLLTFL